MQKILLLVLLIEISAISGCATRPVIPTKPPVSIVIGTSIHGKSPPNANSDYEWTEFKVAVTNTLGTPIFLCEHQVYGHQDEPNYCAFARKDVADNWDKIIDIDGDRVLELAPRTGLVFKILVMNHTGQRLRVEVSARVSLNDDKNISISSEPVVIK